MADNRSVTARAVTLLPPLLPDTDTARIEQLNSPTLERRDQEGFLEEDPFCDCGPLFAAFGPISAALRPFPDTS